MFVDVNVAIAVLNVDDAHHSRAVARLSGELDPKILSFTWGESMIAPYAKGERQSRGGSRDSRSASRAAATARHCRESATDVGCGGRWGGDRPRWS